jgi:DNA primase
MGLFTRDSIDRLRDAVDMVELVGAKTDLRRVGSRYTGLCPFHDERTPSFSVNAVDKLFYCFGCQAKGDAIGFVEQAEGLDFVDAVEMLADRYGVQLERENDDPRAEQERHHKKRLRALLERAASFYSAYLFDSTEARAAREYLASRGLSEEILREFRVGYAPSAWDRMLVGAQKGGFRENELRDAGLAQRNREGRIYDRFRGRIMFPLADRRGQVLGFGARAMRDGQGPKYLNTSESTLFHKGEQLFGLHLAYGPATKSGRIVVVEGYTDVLALHQAGIRDSVAIMGTALTPDQAKRLAAVAKKVVLALDADRSGQEAMLRAARTVGDAELLVVEMPEGKDPAELIAAGEADSFRRRLDRVLPMTQFQLRRVLADADRETPTGIDRALKEAARLIDEHTTEGSMMRDELVREAADHLNLPPERVRAGFGSSRRSAPAAAIESRRELPPAFPAGASAGDVAFGTELEFLVRCLASGDLGRRYLCEPTDDQLTSDVTRRARAHLAGQFDDPLANLPEDEPALTNLVLRVVHTAAEQRPSEENVLRMSILQLERRRLEREIRDAERVGDHARKSEVAAALQRVRTALDTGIGQMA